MVEAVPEGILIFDSADHNKVLFANAEMERIVRGFLTLKTGGSLELKATEAALLQPIGGGA
jgi:hypothetical protein